MGMKLYRCVHEGVGVITSVKLKKSPTPPRILRALSECLRNISPHIWHVELLVLHIWEQKYIQRMQSHSPAPSKTALVSVPEMTNPRND